MTNPSRGQTQTILVQTTSNRPVATLLVPASNGVNLIYNSGPNTIYIGNDNAIQPQDTEVIPFTQGSYIVVSGDHDTFGVAAQGTSSTIYVLDGGLNFFAPPSSLIVQGSTAGVFIYSPAPANGTLVGSWSSAAGTDPYGNNYPLGINVFSGQLTGVLLTNPQILRGILTQAAMSNSLITASTWSGGTITETTITFDSVGGVLLIYSTTSTTTTYSTWGQYTFTAPGSGQISGDVQVFGAGSGGGGGTSFEGGEGGGGGGFSRNQNYPMIGGQQYNVVVGSGGFGGGTGQSGQAGGDSTFDTANNGVHAYGAPTPPGGFAGGPGGAADTTMPISFAGGSGGNGSGTASSGAGSSAGTGTNGNNGTASVGTTPGVGGAAPVGGFAGGNGVAPATNGNSGSGTGAGGSGAGAVTGTSFFTFQYTLSPSGTYYGSDATGGNANGFRGQGTMYQGGESASGGSFNGTQKSLGIILGNPQADLAGKTVDTVSVRLNLLHSWYNSGLTVVLGYTNKTSLPTTWDGSGITAVKQWSQDSQGTAITTDVTGQGLGNAMASGAAKSLSLGPGPGSLNLNYYGYFFGAGLDKANVPLITVNCHTTGGSNVVAGDGIDGSVSVSVRNTQSLIGSLAGAAGTDRFSNNYPAGLGILQPSGQYVKVSGASTDTTQFTCTSVSNTRMTIQWSIPANDAKVNTIYRLIVWGNGTQATTTAVNLISNLYLNGSGGTDLDNTNLSAASGPVAGTNFHWRYQAEVVISSANTAIISGFFGWSQAVASTSSNAVTSTLSDTGKAFTQANANTLELDLAWASVTNSPTITSFGSILERLGP